MSTPSREETFDDFGDNASDNTLDEGTLVNHTPLASLLSKRAGENRMAHSEFQVMTLFIMVVDHNSGLPPRPLILCLSDNLEVVTKACEESFGYPDTPVMNIYVHWAVDGGLNRLVRPFKLNDHNTPTTLRLLKDRNAIDMLEANTPG
jgi:hypothetical protein